MNKLYFLLIMLLTYRICQGQNLIPNPSFEDTMSCPISVSQIDMAIYWSSWRDSPEYFNSCNNGIVGVPNNMIGYQFAHTGNAYAGIIPYDLTGAPYREYIGVHLTSPTIIGQKYYATFYVSWAGMLGFTIAINKLGVSLTTKSYSESNPYPITNNPKAYSDSICSDSIGWSKIQLSFIVDSAYTYLALGNFFDDLQTDTVGLGQFNVHSYYYIDDICLSTDSAYCDRWTEVFNVNNGEVKPEIFPNPFYEKFTIKFKDNIESEIILYDITGRNLLQQKFINSVSLHTEGLAKGIYLYELRNKNGEVKKGKVVKD